MKKYLKGGENWLLTEMKKKIVEIVLVKSTNINTS